MHPKAKIVVVTLSLGINSSKVPRIVISERCNVVDTMADAAGSHQCRYSEGTWSLSEDTLLLIGLLNFVRCLLNIFAILRRL